MTSAEYKRIAVHSAEKYLRFLESNERIGKGYSETKVHRFEIKNAGIVKLFLASGLVNPDDVQVRIRNRIYAQDEIRPQRYEKEKHILYVKLNGELIPPSLDSAEISVVSDLKFLVRRIMDWYGNCQKTLRIPQKPPCITKEAALVEPQPSPGQLDALHGIFNSPLAYIWGAPGTGKTQFVLARAVLAYCSEGKQVLITAPTNNAVEQTLRGVLKVLDAAGIPLDTVVRFGTPSAEFYREYPMVCEIRSVEEEISKIDKRLLFLRKCLNYYGALEWYDSVDTIWREALAQFHELPGVMADIRRQIEKTNVSRKALEASFAPVMSKIDILNVRRKQLIEELNKPRSKMRAWFERKRIERAGIELSGIEAELQKLGGEYNELLAKQESYQQQCNLLEKRFIEKKSALFAVVLRLKSIPPSLIGNRFTSIIQSFDPENISQRQIAGATGALKTIREYIDSRASVYQGVSAEMARRETAELEEQKRKLSPMSAEARLPECRVVASTIDGYIGRLYGHDDFHPAHIFLDEAAYCPLIKAASLLAEDVPLTLLGDHMQLPPVCEMEDDYFELDEYKEVCLWSQSALYLCALFSQSIERIRFHYLNDDLRTNPPQFPKMRQFHLHHSFRFGAELATILGRFVYTRDFQGNQAVKTGIYVIDAASKAGARKNTSPGECEALLAVQNRGRSSELFSNYAILTPFRNQRALLSTSFPSDKVFTIHGSQGREWDTVFLSVTVKTTHMPFITPRLINTAVSRARKNLVIICDSTYWKEQEGHIIGGLVAAAEPIEHAFEAQEFCEGATAM